MDGTSYLPDFSVEWKDEGLILYECKGYLESRDMRNFKKMAQEYADVPVVLVMARPDKKPSRAARYRNVLKYVNGILYMNELKF